MSRFKIILMYPVLFFLDVMIAVTCGDDWKMLRKISNSALWKHWNR